MALQKNWLKRIIDLVRVVASAARTTSGQSSTLTEYGSAKELRAYLDVTATSGTPTLDVVIEDTPDGGTTWFTIGTFAQATGVTKEAINITGPFGEDLRVRWTIGGGTPSLTFSVDILAIGNAVDAVR